MFIVHWLGVLHEFLLLKVAMASKSYPQKQVNADKLCYK